MPTQPLLISYTETADWITGAASRSTPSVSWQAGDVISVIAICEDTTTLGLPTATGLTFTSQKSNNAPTSCGTQLAAAVAGGSGSSAITVTSSAATKHFGIAVWVHRNSLGIGNSAEQHTTTPTVSLTPTDVNSAIVYGMGDWSAVGPLTMTPTPTTTRQAAVDGTAYTRYVADLASQSSAGAVSYGLASGSGTLSIVVLEIKGALGTPLDHAIKNPTLRPAFFTPGIAR